MSHYMTLIRSQRSFFVENVGEVYVETGGFVKDPSSVIYCQMSVKVGMLIANIRWSGLLLLSPSSLFFCVLLCVPW